MSISLVDISEFKESFEYLLHQVNPKYVCHTSHISAKFLYDLICASQEQGLVPKKCKSTITDLVNYIDNSSILSSQCSSSTCEQLLELLKDSKITGLIEAYDEVARQHWNINLPEAHVDVADEKPASVKIVKLIKGSEPLGLKIKHSFDGKAYISSIIPGSAADRSGMFQERDVLLSVNGTHCSSRKKELNDIIAMINSGEERQITFQLLPPSLRNCIPLEKFKTYEYLRACVDYDPRLDPTHSNPDLGLAFSKGDILELIQVENHHWARAKHSEKADNPIGIIPTDEKLSLSESPQDPVASTFAYEPVCQIEPKPDFIRTIVLIGAQGVGRNELRQKLLRHYPSKYKIPVPHTSRPPRPHEKDGIDYHFVGRKQMEEWVLNGSFIESGEYNGNLYGTLDAELLRIIAMKKVPVINAHPSALNFIRNPDFRPLVIFITPPDLPTLKATRLKGNKTSKHSQSRQFTESDLEQMITASFQIEKSYGQFWDTRIVNSDIDTAFATLCSILHKFESEPCWIPLDWGKSC